MFGVQSAGQAGQQHAERSRREPQQGLGQPERRRRSCPGRVGRNTGPREEKQTCGLNPGRGLPRGPEQQQGRDEGQGARVHDAQQGDQRQGEAADREPLAPDRQYTLSLHCADDHWDA